MPTINQLSQLNQLSGSDQLAVYSASNGDARKASLTTLLAYIESAFADPNFVKQYASPNVNGTNVTVASTTNSTWLILTPTSGFASMTVTLPPVSAGIADGTEVLVTCSQPVTTLTIGLNGAVAALGAPTTLWANSSFAMRYDATSTSWYAVQSIGATPQQGTFTPVATLAVPAVNTTFVGRYTLVGNVVTLELQINVGAGGAISFTTAVDFFTGLPAALQPPSQNQTIVSTGQLNTPADPYMVLGYSAQWVFILAGGVSPITINTPGSYRWTVTYLV